MGTKSKMKREMKNEMKEENVLSQNCREPSPAGKINKKAYQHCVAPFAFACT